MDTLEWNEHFSTCVGLLRSMGICLSFVDDFSEIPEIAKAAGKPYLTPIMAPSHNDLLHENAFWLVGCIDDKPVLMGGAMHTHFRQMEIAAYWRSSLSRKYGEAGEQMITNIDPELASTMHGSVVYYGDLFSTLGYRAKFADGTTARGLGELALRAFLALGHLTAQKRWGPDWSYCFLHDDHATRGAGLKYGFDWMVPRPFRWERLPPQRARDEWIAIQRPGSMDKMVRSVSAKIHEIIEANSNVVSLPPASAVAT